MNSNHCYLLSSLLEEEGRIKQLLGAVFGAELQASQGLCQRVALLSCLTWPVMWGSKQGQGAAGPEPFPSNTDFGRLQVEPSFQV